MRLRRLIERFRLWLRSWLGVKDFPAELAQEVKDLQKSRDTQVQKTADLQKRVNDCFARADKLENTLCEATQNLQQQITDLHVSTATSPTKKDEGPQVMNGHVRFSDRKKMYEAKHRVPVITQTGKQIEDNNRAIAAGAKQVE